MQQLRAGAWSLSLLALLAPRHAAAGDSVLVRSLVTDGFVIPGVGQVLAIDRLAINNAGHWLVEVDTDQADTTADGALLRDGVLFLREGQPLPLPVGASIDAFDSINLNNDDASAWNLLLDGIGSASEDSGVFWGTELLIQEGSTLVAPGLSPGTKYVGWSEVKLNDNGLLLMMASLDDPALPSSVDRALIAAVFAPGFPPAQVLLAREGDLLPGQTEPVGDFLTGPHSFAINNGATVLFVADLNGDPSRDVVVYSGATILAQEGSPSPSAGRNWASLAETVLDLNDQGDWCLLGRLEGDPTSDMLLVLNGQKLVQEGDVLADIAPYHLTDFGSGPVFVDADGDVLWWGQWSDPNGDLDSGLFLNDRLIVQEGVTVIDGLALDTIWGVQDGVAMSEDGRFILFRGTLQGGIDGAFQIYPAAASTPVSGCIGNAGSLVASAPILGTNATLIFDQGQSMPAAVLLGFGAQSSLSAGCGMLLDGVGEVLIDSTPPAPLYFQPPFWTGQPLAYTIAIPNDAVLVCQQLWLQAAFVDLLGLSPAEPVRLTNGVQWTIGGAP